MPAALVSIFPTGSSFQAALANLSEKGNAESDAQDDRSQSNSDPGIASRGLIKQDKVQSSSIGSDAGVRTTAAALPATVVVANGRNWHTTRTTTGVRIASTPATVPSSTSATAAPACLPGISIQAAPLKSSKQTNADKDTLGGGLQTHSDAGALTTATLPPIDQPVARAADQPSQPTNGNRPNDGATGTLAQSFDVSAPSAGQDVPQQLPLFQSVAAPAEWSATSVMQLNSAPPSGGMVAGEARGGRTNNSKRDATSRSRHYRSSEWRELQGAGGDVCGCRSREPWGLDPACGQISC